MDAETLKRVEKLEHELSRIGREIRRLEQEREEALLSIDEEYAAYIEHYRAFYNDEPLSPRQYYEKMAELEAINAEWVAGQDYEELWRKHKDRLQYLERVLAA